jgi:hypothetical protein
VPSLFGIETEYGLAAAGNAPSPRQNAAAALAVVANIRRHEPSLDAAGGGIFVANGSRVYFDATHLEVSTPEVTCPWDAVRYTLAGERMLEQAVDRRYRRRPQARPRVFKSNVDYAARATWACHESVLVCQAPDSLVRELTPHLASRVIYAGAGGLDPFSPGITFSLSPRAHFIRSAEARQPRFSMGFAYGKDDPLTRGPHDRIHLTCGESLCSERAMWLRSATTVLVVALLDNGIVPGAEVALADPVAALRQFSTDPALKAAATLADGGSVTAIDLQRRFLGLTEAHVDAPFMPPWARAACDQWRSVLDHCERGHARLHTSLDWCIKRTLFGRVLARHGLGWAEAARVTDAAARFWLTAGESSGPGLHSGTERLRDPAFRAHAQACGALDTLTSRGASWEQLVDLLAARDELCECDIRFGELGGRGIFAELDRAGVLTHHMPGVRPISPALTTPPSSTRAKVRGEAVRELAGGMVRYTCDWAGIASDESDHWLDLDDPLGVEARWHGRAAGPGGGRP